MSKELQIWRLPGGCLLYLHGRFGELPEAEPHQPPSVIMPFGKCRGWCLQEVVAGDPQYAGWLMAQRWFEQKYPRIFQYFATHLMDDAEGGPSAA